MKTRFTSLIRSQEKSAPRIIRIGFGLFTDSECHRRPHVCRPHLVTLIGRMETVARKIFRMRRKLIFRDRVHIENGHAMPLRNLLQALIELKDLLLIMTSHEYRYTRATRYVGNVCYHYLRVRFLSQSTQNLFVILCKLLDRQTMSDVIDPDTDCYQIGINADATFQLPAHEVFRRRATDTKVHQPGTRPLF